jgi:hypothetical protein
MNQTENYLEMLDRKLRDSVGADTPAYQQLERELQELMDRAYANGVSKAGVSHLLDLAQGRARLIEDGVPADQVDDMVVVFE